MPSWTRELSSQYGQFMFQEWPGMGVDEAWHDATKAVARLQLKRPATPDRDSREAATIGGRDRRWSKVRSP
ncbi:hypothetical protein RHIZ404_210327 [Rhizobium sp. EC-SD404]|nr:hypothetical protein RHIZ404_210327 [Rhizobium sp. EC-SD404]